MWVFGKIRERVENIPQELNRYMRKGEEDLPFSSKTGSSQNLHSNIITPDNIPEFCLPPRLCRRSPLPEVEKGQLFLDHQKQYSSATQTSPSQKASKKPLPFSAEDYGLVGLYERPNTRRKESLLLSKSSGYVFELFSCKHRPGAGSSERETPSSDDDSPFGSCYKSPNIVPSRRGCLKQTKSCPLLFEIKEKSGRLQKVGLSLTSSPCSPPTSEEPSLTLSPPVPPSLDILQCQERLQHEHVLPLQGFGKVHLSAEQTTFSNNNSSTLYSLRVRVVSVEGLSDETDQCTLNCAVSLCLTPGKLQQQKSATIRNCRSPVFNEDFFFTELSHKDLVELQLRVKVVNKPAAGALRRGVVIGMTSVPLKQLLLLRELA
ncbi:C2 calcium-dependent domain-containing protein 4C [Nothobranchius furzeri]|uniref:C2 calcium-dependent domain-containing protein 4C-like n=1 Tax=Nothobranchius furzeri TaxID=105023 RepID=A0A8C6Q5X2_NOTFU|nr:C2 calcium-dependent domain-containing protein 4C-like [Nothobranchius furzeri]